MASLKYHLKQGYDRPTKQRVKVSLKPTCNISAPDSKIISPKSSMVKHHEYKADIHSLYNHPNRELICYWVVQYNIEPCVRHISISPPSQ